MQYWEKVVWVVVCVLLLAGCVKFVSASPLDDYNITDEQKGLICDSLNMSFFECFGLWEAVDNIYFECEVLNYSGLMNESDCSNGTIIVNETCETDSQFDMVDAWLERGVKVEPVFLNGEFTNFKIAEDSFVDGVEPDCSSQLEAEYLRGKEFCENNPDSQSWVDDVKAGEKATPLYVWIGGICIAVFIAWKKGWLKKFTEGKNGGGATVIPPALPVLPLPVAPVQTLPSIPVPAPQPVPSQSPPSTAEETGETMCASADVLVSDDLNSIEFS